MNKTILLLSILFLTVFTLHKRQDTHLQLSHHLNEDLCKSKGGIVCGFVQKDCCAKGCESKYLGLNEECTEGKIINLDTLTCEKLCENKEGTVYTDKIYGQPKCCKKGSIQNDTCPEASQIPLGEC